MATTSGGTTTTYTIDPAGLGSVVAAYNGNGGLIAHYTYGAALVSQTSATGTYYYAFDGSANTSGLTNSVGTIVNSYTYEPFGSVLTSTQQVANPFQFVGQSGVMVEGDGLSFMRARFYVPSIGRFTTPDPSGFSGGDSNTYRYCGNSPVNATDPSALVPMSTSWGFNADYIPGNCDMECQQGLNRDLNVETLGPEFAEAYVTFLGTTAFGSADVGEWLGIEGLGVELPDWLEWAKRAVEASGIEVPDGNLMKGKWAVAMEAANQLNCLAGNLGRIRRIRRVCRRHGRPSRSGKL